MTLTVMNSVDTDNKKLEVGTNKLTWNLETCTKGIYLLNFQWANVNQTIRLIKN